MTLRKYVLFSLSMISGVMRAWVKKAHPGLAELPVVPSPVRSVV
jgi:hypothetical protein